MESPAELACICPRIVWTRSEECRTKGLADEDEREENRWQGHRGEGNVFKNGVIASSPFGPVAASYI
jgi:hypothetical protein